MDVLCMHGKLQEGDRAMIFNIGVLPVDQASEISLLLNPDSPRVHEFSVGGFCEENPASYDFVIIMVEAVPEWEKMASLCSSAIVVYIGNTSDSKLTDYIVKQHSGGTAKPSIQAQNLEEAKVKIWGFAYGSEIDRRLHVFSGKKIYYRWPTVVENAPRECWSTSQLSILIDYLNDHWAYLRPEFKSRLRACNVEEIKPTINKLIASKSSE